MSAIYTEPRSPPTRKCANRSGSSADVVVVNYDGGRSVHLWALEAGFELVHAAAYHSAFPQRTLQRILELDIPQRDTFPH